MPTLVTAADVVAALEPDASSSAAAFLEVPRLLAAGERESPVVGPELRAIVAAHHRMGHRVVLLVPGAVADAAGLLEVVGADDVLPLGHDPRPELRLREYAAEHGVDLAASHLYGGRLESLPLLLSVGTPRPTQPQGDLQRAAERAGWPVLRLPSRGRPRTDAVIRTAAAYGTLLPSMIGGVAAGLLRRDRQQIVQFGVGAWVDQLFALTGVTLRVVGEEHLWAQRPAVFVYNHRNNFDPYVAIRLVKRDWGSVGKKELAGPLTPLAQWLTPNVAYVDRSSSDKAVASLAPVTRLLGEGVSVLVAPEGTRTRTGQLGPFKKGPFQMARAAGVPVVPIVIRDADAVAGRSAAVIRSGTVDVAVLPPVDVAAWRDGELAERVAEVRQSFLTTLADWPTDVPSQEGASS